jgi:hypothetical protein
MADLGFGDSGFDANAPENQRTNSVVPAGEYPAIMVESEKKSTNANDGHYLNTKWQIVAGEFQNRIVFQKYNLWLAPHKETALQIARGQFSECCRAVGVNTPRDSSELHNKPVMIKVKVKKDDQYGDQNEITAYKPVGKPATSAPTIAAASTTGEPW